MGNKEYYKNKRRKRKLIGRFILTVFVIVFVFSAVFVLAATALKSQRDKQEAINSESKSDLSTTIADKKINVAILGTDAEEIHSDVNIVVSFDTETGEASFVSVPRDTQVFMS